MTDREIFAEALRIEVGQKRNAFLDEACGSDHAQRQRLDQLLEEVQKLGSFLESPAPDACSAFRQSNPNDANLADIATELAEARGTSGFGKMIGSYKLLEEIGQGGMGVVYMAEQTAPVKRRVALKIIKPGMDSRQIMARFEAERQALAMMDHPNIAKVLDAGTTESGRLYFVMELVKGTPITQYCDEHRLSPRQRLELFIPVCLAIQHAHQKGIIHRDVKPSNVLVAEYDDVPVSKVIDFGVAKAIGQELVEQTMFTHFGQIIGTLEYMSPEQAKVNQLDIDTRSDIYSLGVLLYELLTGETPFDKARLRSAAWDETVRILREEEPPKPSHRLSSSHKSLPSIASVRSIEPRKLSALVRGELDWIVMKALEKDRNRRYVTASDFAQDVKRYLEREPVLAGPPTARYRFRKLMRKYRRPVTAAMSALLLLLAALAVSVGFYLRADHDRAVAEKSQADLSQESKSLAEALSVVQDERDQRLAALEDRTRALWQTEKALTRANALRMTALSAAELPQNPRHALLLAMEAARREPDLAAVNNALIEALGTCREVESWDHPAICNRLQISPDGKLLAIAQTDHVVVIRNASSGNIVCQLGVEDRLPEITQITFSPDSRRLLTLFQGHCIQRIDDGQIRANTDRVARIWDVQTGQEVAVLRGHQNRISDACFSQDGSRIATSAWDGQCRVWDSQTGECQAVSSFRVEDVGESQVSPEGELNAQPAALVAVSFSPDGSQLLAASARQILNSRIETPEQYDPEKVDPAFDPNEVVIGQVASGYGFNFRGLDGNPPGDVGSFDATTGAPLVRFSLSPNTDAFAVRFSGDQRHVLVALSGSARVQCYDATTGDRLADESGEWGKPFYRNDAMMREIVESKGPKQADILSLVLQQRCTELGDKFAEMRDNIAIIKDTNTHEVLAELKGHEEDIRDLCFAADGQNVWTVGSDHTLRRWSVEPRPVYRDLVAHTDKVIRARFSPAGDQLVTASADGTAIVWSTENSKALYKLSRSFPPEWHRAEEHLAGPLTDACFSSTGRQLLVASEDPYATITSDEGLVEQQLPFEPTRIWDAQSGEVEMSLPGAILEFPGDADSQNRGEIDSSQATIFPTRGYADVAAVFTPLAGHAITVDGPQYKFVRIRGARLGTEAGGQTGPITLSDSNRQVLGPFHAVRVWDLQRKALKHTLPCQQAAVVPRISADGLVAITAGKDQAIVWDTLTGQERCRLPVQLENYPEFGDLTISPAGKWLLVPAYSDEGALLYDLTTGAIEHRFKIVCHAAAFSEDEETLVTINGGVAQMWQGPNWEHVCQVAGHKNTITGASFSPDGNWLVTFGYDTSARVWNTATGIERVTLSGHRAQINWAAFSPDGNHIVTASNDHTARIWPLDMLGEAESRSPCNFTEQERSRFEIPKLLENPSPRTSQD